MTATLDKGADPTGRVETSKGSTSRIGYLRHIARQVTGGRSHLLVVAASLLVYAVAYVVAHLLRFEFAIPDKELNFMAGTVAFAVMVKLIVFYGWGAYRILWAYVGLRDLLVIFQASLVGSIGLVAANYILHRQYMLPRSVVILDGVITFLGVGALYAALRWVRESEGQSAPERLSDEPILIAGAGDAGETLLREILRNPLSGVRVVGFLDDDPAKRGRSLRGVPVLGKTGQAKEVARGLGVKKAYIAIPSAGGAVIKRVAGHLLEAGLAIKVLPPISELSGSPSLAPKLREISIEDLLRREPIKLDTKAISDFIKGKVVLVTGGAGSIGSELCRQVLDFQPARLAVLDRAESPLHDLILELKTRASSADVRPELADITDEAGVKAVFERHKPEVVFHAAALKHVPLLQDHAREAVRVNIGGTRIVAEAARAAGAGAFVLISTDKAVNPANVMGATKRVAELMIHHMSRQPGPTRFATVRFGNVLGSQGSVIPIFKGQISRGGPVTVTHPDMKRYFMTIPEAVQLILQAAVLGKGGEIFLLDMGKPVRIMDLAEDLIRLSGLVPGVDVKIEVTGVRPGEKLDEELKSNSEDFQATSHPQLSFLPSPPSSSYDDNRARALERRGNDGGPVEKIAEELRALTGV
jgi:FlaA1/EpsC-like NDP-sugar epimerase